MKFATVFGALSPRSSRVKDPPFSSSTVAVDLVPPCGAGEGVDGVVVAIPPGVLVAIGSVPYPLCPPGAAAPPHAAAITTAVREIARSTRRRYRWGALRAIALASRDAAIPG